MYVIGVYLRLMTRETVVETDEFERLARAIMSDGERTELVETVAANPLIGVELGSGLRKFRFARQGAGKRGGFRVIHYYQAKTGSPVFLLLVYPKNTQDNLSPSQLKGLRLLADTISSTYGRQQ